MNAQVGHIGYQQIYITPDWRGVRARYTLLPRQPRPKASASRRLTKSHSCLQEHFWATFSLLYLRQHPLPNYHGCRLLYYHAMPRRRISYSYCLSVPWNECHASFDDAVDAIGKRLLGAEEAGDADIEMMSSMRHSRRSRRFTPVPPELMLDGNMICCFNT